MPDFSIGVDLGGTNLRIAAVSAGGHMLEKVTLSTKVAMGPDHVITEMCDAIRRLTAKHSADGRFLGAGLGIPGIIDLDTGTIRKSANLPGFSEYPVHAEIERRLESRVLLDNDGNVAGLGEQWLGAARGVPTMAMLTLGTGIGGAIIINGKIFHGMNGMSGEFGHVTVEPEGYPCGCGNRGCAERYASATGTVRMAQDAIAAGDAPGLAQAASRGPEFGARAIYDLAMQGDEAARRVFRRFGRALGIMMAGIVNTLNLEMYVIGGGASSAWDAFAPTMFEEMRERSIVYAATAPEDPMGDDRLRYEAGLRTETVQQPVSLSPPPNRGRKKLTIVTRAILGSDAGLYGGARLAVL
jgi:glucokinase